MLMVVMLQTLGTCLNPSLAIGRGYINLVMLRVLFRVIIASLLNCLIVQGFILRLTLHRDVEVILFSALALLFG